MATIEAGDLTIHYREAGMGRPLILLHGGMATAEVMWGNRVLQLGERWHVIAPDTRGHGKTPNPGGQQLTYPMFADDLMAMITAMKLERPHIVGYSDGGQTALEFGLRHPGVAATLTLGGTMSQKTPDYIAGMKSFGFPTVGEVDWAVFQESMGDFFEVVTQMQGAGADNWKELVRQTSTLWPALPDYTDEQLGQITDPVLVLSGDRDELANLDEASRLYRGVKNGALGIVPNSPHGAAGRDDFWMLMESFAGRHENRA